MADAVLLLIMAMSLLLFGLQEFLDPAKRTVWSLNFRAATMMLIGLYLFYLYYEMGAAAGAAAPINAGYGPIGG
jgi:hypothetical protein